LLPPTDAKMTAAEGVPTEFVIDVHGESYRVDITGIGIKADGKRRFFLSLDGMPEEVVVQPLNTYVAGEPQGRKPATEQGHVSTHMPGVIIDVLVREGQVIEAGQPVLIAEAMKMQSEVKAPIGGRVARIYVARGDRVNPGETLVEIRP